IEQEGTYPLPEAQLDRFFFHIRVLYPSWEEEIEIMKRVTGPGTPGPGKVLPREEILSLQALVRRVPVADHIYAYAAKLARSTRPEDRDAPAFVREYLAWGAGPRASLSLILAGKARAVLRGRRHVAIEDVRAVAPPVLRHRIIPNFSARSEGLSSDDLIERLLRHVPADERLYDAT
ncbi:MAG: MoxR family ATPase, partial [Planctomycetes bacterium]|nr:MoxR family ATPase [Planctomycetota bacterium]